MHSSIQANAKARKKKLLENIVALKPNKLWQMFDQTTVICTQHMVSRIRKRSECQPITSSFEMITFTTLLPFFITLNRFSPA